MRRRNAKRCSNQRLRTPAESCLLANLKRLIPLFLILVCFHSGLELAIAAPSENSLIFERLCRDFRQQQSPESRNLLLQFCKKPDAGEWAGLGYFLLGFQDFEKNKFDSAGKYFSLASQKPLVIEDYVLYYWGSTLSQLDQKEKEPGEIGVIVEELSR